MLLKELIDILDSNNVTVNKEYYNNLIELLAMTKVKETPDSIALPVNYADGFGVAVLMDKFDVMLFKDLKPKSVENELPIVMHVCKFSETTGNSFYNVFDKSKSKDTYVAITTYVEDAPVPPNTICSVNIVNAIYHMINLEEYSKVLRVLRYLVTVTHDCEDGRTLVNANVVNLQDKEADMIPLREDVYARVKRCDAVKVINERVGWLVASRLVSHAGVKSTGIISDTICVGNMDNNVMIYPVKYLLPLVLYLTVQSRWDLFVDGIDDMSDLCDMLLNYED